MTTIDTETTVRVGGPIIVHGVAYCTVHIDAPGLFAVSTMSWAAGKSGWTGLDTVDANVRVDGVDYRARATPAEVYVCTELGTTAPPAVTERVAAAFAVALREFTAEVVKSPKVLAAARESLAAAQVKADEAITSRRMWQDVVAALADAQGLTASATGVTA